MPNINKVNGDKERAVKHYIIAATQGEDDSTEMLMRGFMVGLVAKNVLDVTLHLCSSFVIRRHTTVPISRYQTAVDATKSPQRKEAEDFFRGKGLM